MSDSPESDPEVFQRLCQLLDGHQVAYDVLRHAPVFTSAEAAAIRGTTLASGAKALVCKIDDGFSMFVLPADCKLNAKSLRQQFGWKSIRFASGDEVREWTGLAPGSIPPFGMLFHLPTYCEKRLLDQPRINFNAGDHGISVSMSLEDYLRVQNPQLAEFAQ